MQHAEAPNALTEPGVRRGVLLSVAYDGRGFVGYAPQPGQRSVASELLRALRAVDPTIVHLRGASRTDSGVHARDQRVAFDPELIMPSRGWVLSVNRFLPPDLSVRSAARVPERFTPRFASLGKHYRYLLLRDCVRDPFLEGRVWRTDAHFDERALASIQAEALSALGTHDFAAFRSSADIRTNTVRTVRALSMTVDPIDARLCRIDIEGNAFMHNMVRILVGTLVDVGRGYLPQGAIARALASGSRRDAGITAPPDGLSLERVVLADEGTDAWP